MTEPHQPTVDDAKRYCPVNSKSRGDNQMALCPDYDYYDEGLCLIDHERCHYETCSTLKEILRQRGREQG